MIYSTSTVWTSIAQSDHTKLAERAKRWGWAKPNAMATAYLSLGTIDKRELRSEKYVLWTQDFSLEPLLVLKIERLVYAL